MTMTVDNTLDLTEEKWTIKIVIQVPNLRVSIFLTRSLAFFFTICDWHLQYTYSLCSFALVPTPPVVPAAL